MSNQEILIFITIQIAMVCWAFWESYMEGDTGWTWNPKWWRIKLPKGYTYTAYHIWAFWIFAPIVFIVLPLISAGFSWRLFWLLTGSYLFGSVIEDFTWFVVNPCYPFSKWNPRDTLWYPWFTIGKFSLPLSYIAKLAISLIIFLGPFRYS
ncbi:hypothetical protein CO009_02780 [Candidatus Shapirobacteria bacterium CG_4_8_14_3_um_filter_35_11]|uniref:Uncharacterized protein n=3 Tax=Candidatus Shapironibacteriota TaxID=1752721 RepID=A0A2M8L1R4_9BACT|nr:MAG: hypothetical protein CO009_02780 [Candidatus Shapirobacteria bacterium CG_4_8_14_3_um_filter_35_11]PJE66822.1 MAG: hypothetical protein COU93_02210 [Candidatus Shapirobacteria bacterium CG10_big_fil_rev_8_21_14_0_10_36_6]